MDYMAPFSFVYNNTRYCGFDASFKETDRSESENAIYTDRAVTLHHDVSGVDFVCHMRLNKKYDACEWTVIMQNNKNTVTDVFSEIYAVDMDFKGKMPVLNGIHGDLGDMYGPYAVDLSVPGSDVVQESVSGRPTHGNFPYYNLQYGDGGTFIAMGWPGTWKMAFRHISDDTVHLTGGQRNVACRLLPGETLRLPLIVMLNYKGRDLYAAMNLWRHWFIECNMRWVDGRSDSERNVNNVPFSPVLSTSQLGQGADAEYFIRKHRAFTEHDIPLDYMWIDAGWYTNCKGETCPWPETGTLDVDRSRYAKGFCDISDDMAASGAGTLLWFEPEVVRQDKEAYLAATPCFKREWMLGTAMKGIWIEGRLLDYGNPDYRDWLFDKSTSILDKGHIKLYRQDFNVDPAPVWAECDSAAGPDRNGITENSMSAVISRSGML